MGAVTAVALMRAPHPERHGYFPARPGDLVAATMLLAGVLQTSGDVRAGRTGCCDAGRPAGGARDAGGAHTPLRAACCARPRRQNAVKRRIQCVVTTCWCFRVDEGTSS